MKWLQKIAVLIPVVLLSFCFFKSRHLFAVDSFKRSLLLLATMAVLYGWMLLHALLTKQQGLLKAGIQSSFYVYIFAVLTLTGYFILYREVSAHAWWERMLRRIDRRDHVNLELFKAFSIYSFTDRQVVGNFLLLLPLGIYLPALYRGCRNFFLVAVIAFAFSFCIELLQLVTSYRSADVDDLFLNTTGACAGYLLFVIGRWLLRRDPPAPTMVALQ